MPRHFSGTPSLRQPFVSACDLDAWRLLVASWMARGFNFRHPVTGAEEAGMLPLLDFVNHASDPTCKWDLVRNDEQRSRGLNIPGQSNNSTAVFKLLALRRLSPGDPITMKYQGNNISTPNPHTYTPKYALVHANQHTCTRK